MTDPKLGRNSTKPAVPYKNKIATPSMRSRKQAAAARKARAAHLASMERVGWIQSEETGKLIPMSDAPFYTISCDGTVLLGEYGTYLRAAEAVEGTCDIIIWSANRARGYVPMIAAEADALERRIACYPMSCPSMMPARAKENRDASS